jgi:hypothetical protein
MQHARNPAVCAACVGRQKYQDRPRWHRLNLVLLLAMRGGLTLVCIKYYSKCTGDGQTSETRAAARPARPRPDPKIDESKRRLHHGGREQRGESGTTIRLGVSISTAGTLNKTLGPSTARHCQQGRAADTVSITSNFHTTLDNK